MPRMLEHTVSIKARAPFPPACVTNATPEARVVGTQENTVRPTAYSLVWKGILNIKNPKQGVMTRMAAKP